MPFPRSFFVEAPARPRLVKCLRVLCAEIDARWPDRSDHLDGWIGDPAHRSRTSDHNPDALGVVHALDVTALGINPERVVFAAMGHPAVTYVIFAGSIRSRRTMFSRQSYDGPNPHNDHIHISVDDSPASWSARPWLK